jgi:hypothetical protein
MQCKNAHLLTKCIAIKTILHQKLSTAQKTVKLTTNILLSDIIVLNIYKKGGNRVKCTGGMSWGRCGDSRNMRNLS